jgi:glycine cleavage system H protein
LITFDDERGVGTVSITEYAQKSLGDVVFVELPEKGTTIEQGGELSFATPLLPPASPPYHEKRGSPIPIQPEI